MMNGHDSVESRIRACDRRSCAQMLLRVGIAEHRVKRICRLPLRVVNYSRAVKARVKVRRNETWEMADHFLGRPLEQINKLLLSLGFNGEDVYEGGDVALGADNGHDSPLASGPVVNRKSYLVKPTAVGADPSYSGSFSQGSDSRSFRL
jgi:hypothetical protein